MPTSAVKSWMNRRWLKPTRQARSRTFTAATACSRASSATGIAPCRGGGQRRRRRSTSSSTANRFAGVAAVQSRSPRSTALRPPEAFEIDVAVGELLDGYAEAGDRAARSEVHADDRRVLERVDQEEFTIRPRDNRPGISATAVRVCRVVNPDLVVAEVDHQFDRT